MTIYLVLREEWLDTGTIVSDFHAAFSSELEAIKCAAKLNYVNENYTSNKFYILAYEVLKK